MQKEKGLNPMVVFLRTVLVWFGVLALVVTVASLALPFTPTFPYAHEVLPSFGGRPLTTWANFDGVHYLTIIEKGYKGTGLIQAFFPLYPLIVGTLSFGVLNPIVVGVIISLASFAGAIYYLYHLVLMTESPKVAGRVLWLLLLFPTSFFFGALYTESLFLLLVVGCFYAWEKKRYGLAGVIGLLAASTRLVGVFLVPALLISFIGRKNFNLTLLRDKRFWSALLPITGILAYMAYLQIVFGDPLLFYSVQTDFGADRATETLVFYPQVVWRYAKMLGTVDITSTLYYRILLELLSGLFGLLGLVWSFWVTKKSWAVFGLLALLLPTLTGTFSSMPRYLLPLFPLYIVLAKKLPDISFKICLVIFGILLAINLILFTQGIFVA
jgi:hypothetical protein